MLHVLIMAGGKGTRFWPLSRSAKPKQFLSIVDQRTLMDATLDRVAELVAPEQCWILGNATQAEALESLTDRVPASRILQEPFGKNTAACMAWGVFEVMKEDPDAVCVVLSADAWIQPVDAFHETLRAAVTHVEATSDITIIGIPPTRPHTGYGYIQTQEKPNLALSPVNVTSFTEKPDLKTAMTYVESGNYYWNAGIFVFKALSFLEALNEHMPDHYACIKAFTDKGLRFPADIASYYEQLESISIDYGLMEKLSGRLSLVEASFQWDDIGSWAALEAYLPKDEHGNAVRGRVVTHESSGNILFSDTPGKLMAVSGVDELVVVDTSDALLIVPKNNDQDVKAIYDKLEKRYT